MIRPATTIAIGAETCCQGQHHFDLVLFDALDHQVDQVTDQPAKHHAADCLMGEQHRGGAHGGRLAQLCDTQQYGKHHYGCTVVEQRLADDRGFQWFRRIGGTQHAQHRNRVGGRDQRAEQQAVEETHVPAEQGEDVVRQAADHPGGDQHAKGRQQADGPTVAAQVVEVHVQGAGEQQERQHPVHQQVAEVDLANQLLDTFLQAWVAEHAQALQDQRKQQGGDHHANGGRQADKTEVHIGEQGGEANEGGDKFKHPGSLGRWERGFNWADAGAAGAPRRRLV